LNILIAEYKLLKKFNKFLVLAKKKFSRILFLHLHVKLTLMTIKIYSTISLCIFLFILSSCEKIFPSEPNPNELLDGPVEGLSMEQQLIFLEGDIAFNDLIFTAETGLGPIFVEKSCGSCHTGDGKGHPSTQLTRFGKMENGVFNHMLDKGGPQLQNRSIPGYNPENIPNDATGITVFVAPAITGLGFLESVSDADLLAMTDPNDGNGDGISGVVNYVYPPDYFTPASHHISKNGMYIGRFGKKAGLIDLLQQTINAAKEDMGVTSDFDMEEPINYAVSAQHIDNVPDPEMSAATVNTIVFYLRTLKAPIPRNQNDPDVITGREIFNLINCAGCHKPSLTTSYSDIDQLSNVTFYPYTDLLMHDMGPELDDNYTEGTASTSEWKTPALWGLGLSPNAQGGSYFLMHDGRARSIEEAILMHGGEAEQSKNNFIALSNKEKHQLLIFLENL